MPFKRIWNTLFWFFVKPFRTAYRFIVRPQGRGAKVLITCGNNILLVRTTYGHKSWTVPGGGVGGRETPEAAARRELYEELGLKVEQLVSIGEYTSTLDNKTDTVSCFHAPLESLIDMTPDMVEIAETKWFDLEELPEKRVPRVDKIIALYKQSVI